MKHGFYRRRPTFDPNAPAEQRPRIETDWEPPALSEGYTADDTPAEALDEDAGDDAEIALTKAKLKEMVADERYWRRRDPVFFADVTKAFQAAYPDAGYDAAGRICRTEPKPIDLASFGASAKARFIEARGSDGLADVLRRAALTQEQNMTILTSDLGRDVATTFERLQRAAGASGVVPASIWQPALARLGVDDGSILDAARAPTDGSDEAPKIEPTAFVPKEASKAIGDALGAAWRWLNQDIPWLAEFKQREAARFDKLLNQQEAARRDPDATWLHRSVIGPLGVANAGESRALIELYPTTHLDLLALGIAQIGTVRVGTRTLAIFRRGNHIFDHEELATGASKSSKTVSHIDEYDPVQWRRFNEEKYGKENVISTTVPTERFSKLRNTRNKKSGIWYDDRGFPIFDPVAKYDTRIPQSARMLTSRASHQEAATK